MSTVNLTAADQPDNYHGAWCQHYVRYLFADTTEGLWHLGVSGYQDGTYCTRMNPRGCVDLAGQKIYYSNGRCFKIPRQGVKVSIFMHHKSINPVVLPYRKQVLQPCPDCLTMAAVTAEMYGQNTYPVKRLLKDLEHVKTPAHN
ncbi:hypothetical protein [Corynebacterium pseudodiphtheriticum]|uniref:Uncharacterized protein n=1 Tax=Corynebacterium pseudodiphtheriticum TaxID=37637 RepID=A0ABT7FW60_9CORY|nr:hypothetical protein [Corynebacterium pseudodiphtheriticum]MDK4290229.1 hypothetical protein [Corynebacterium pseudodiphtheriticum]